MPPSHEHDEQIAASTYRLWVSADRQTLVRVWSDGTAEVAHRGPSGIWGPTVKLIEERVS